MKMNAISFAVARSNRVLKNSVLFFLVLTLAITAADVGGIRRCNREWMFPHKTQQERRHAHFLHTCDQTMVQVSLLKLLTTRGGAGRFDQEYTSRKNHAKGNSEKQHISHDYISSQQLDNKEIYDECYDDDYRHQMTRDTSGTAKNINKNNFVTSSLASMTSLPNVLKNGDKKLGVGFLGSGALITMLGITLFFNRTLMRIGNLLFIAGIPMTIGPSRTIGYFAQPEKIRSSACLLLGIFLVLMGYPTFGIALEIFGLLNLFGNMFPFLLLIAKQLPGMNTLFNVNSRMPSTKATKRNTEQSVNEDYLDYLDGDSSTTTGDVSQLYDDYHYSVDDNHQRYQYDDGRSKR